MKWITRRDFLKKISVATGAALAIPKIMPFLNKSTFCATPTVLAKVSGKSPALNTKKAVDTLGGMMRFVSKGDVVMIKPNIAWSRGPRYAATTNPDVVSELVRMCLDAGAKQVKVTDNTCNDARTCFQLSGIEKAVKKAGGDIFYTEKYMFKEMELGGEFVKKWPVNKEIIDADVLINVPIAKHHKLSQLTLGMKNWIGAVGGGRFGLHQDINQSIVDLAGFFKPDLTVIDCTRILVDHGPQGGNLTDVREMDTIIASTDPVAADSCAAELFNLQGKDIVYIRLADKNGLGNMDLNQVAMETLTA